MLRKENNGPSNYGGRGGRGVRLCHVCPAFADLKQTFKFIPLSNFQHLNGTLKISGKISLKVLNQVQLIKPFIQITDFSQIPHVLKL